MDASSNCTTERFSASRGPAELATSLPKAFPFLFHMDQVKALKCIAIPWRKQRITGLISSNKHHTTGNSDTNVKWHEAQAYRQVCMRWHGVSYFYVCVYCAYLCIQLTGLWVVPSVFVKSQDKCSQSQTLVCVCMSRSGGSLPTDNGPAFILMSYAGLVYSQKEKCSEQHTKFLRKKDSLRAILLHHTKCVSPQRHGWWNELHYNPKCFASWLPVLL